MKLTKKVTNWKRNIHHVDIWIGPTESNIGEEVVDCEKALTPKRAGGVIREPGVGYDVVGMYISTRYLVYIYCGVYMRGFVCVYMC